MRGFITDEDGPIDRPFLSVHASGGRLSAVLIAWCNMHLYSTTAVNRERMVLLYPEYVPFVSLVYFG